MLWKLCITHDKDCVEQMGFAAQSFALALNITPSRRMSAPTTSTAKPCFPSYFYSIKLTVHKAPLLKIGSTQHIAHFSNYPSDSNSLLIFLAASKGHEGAVSTFSLCEEAGAQQLHTAQYFTRQHNREMHPPFLIGNCQKAEGLLIAASQDALG